MVNSFLEKACRWLLDPTIKVALGEELYSKLFGKIFSANFHTADLEKNLNAVPGELSSSEKLFLYNFLATIWTGNRNVLEIGPFLGSSTRAIALGMFANEKRDPNCQLHTYDRFGKYYDRQALLQTLSPLFSSAMLASEVRVRLENAADFPDFLEVFTELHRNQSYSNLLSVHKKNLPGSREGIGSQESLLILDPNIKFEVVFNDGCKSWYSIKYLTLEMSKCVEPGAYVISQDYRWRSCFWLPVFFSLFEDFFELVAFVRTTYVFRLTRSLDPGIIEARFPDTPIGFGIDNFNRLFPVLIRKASERGDLQTTVYATLQHAAALAYVGCKDEAIRIIEDLEKQPIAQSFLANIKKHRINPTYYPDGQEILLS
ncbi:MAG: hypothetical protein IT291_08655 [Deltaproteobacteria bacterium]|nr:hypothetical protein [Deltaproteobacteria bacterium]